MPTLLISIWLPHKYWSSATRNFCIFLPMFILYVQLWENYVKLSVPSKWETWRISVDRCHVAHNSTSKPETLHIQNLLIVFSWDYVCLALSLMSHTHFHFSAFPEIGSYSQTFSSHKSWGGGRVGRE